MNAKNQSHSIISRIFNITQLMLLQVRVCDSCFEQFGPKEVEGQVGVNTSPIKAPKNDLLDSDLPAEYLASPLAQQVIIDI